MTPDEQQPEQEWHFTAFTIDGIIMEHIGLIVKLLLIPAVAISLYTMWYLFTLEECLC